MEKLGAKHQNLDQKVYQMLRTMILDRKLSPGAKILQDKLAQDLGVSRTPLVNALKMLEHEKLIVAMPRRGFYVRLFSREEMIHILELREVLEGLAARRAAVQASDEQIKHLRKLFEKMKAAAAAGEQKKYADEDRQFHNALVEMGKREFLTSILQSYNIITFSYQFQHHDGLIRIPDETINEHQMIVEAIERHDSQSAEEITRRHFSKSTTVLKEEFATELDAKQLVEARQTKMATGRSFF